jgi:hypothetical protein
LNARNAKLLGLVLKSLVKIAPKEFMIDDHSRVLWPRMKRRRSMSSAIRRGDC